MEFSVSLAKLVNDLGLEVVYTPCDVDKIRITSADVNRPGLLLAGYHEYFDPTRIQICGKVEMSFLEALPENERRSRIHTLFATKPVAVAVARSLYIYDSMLEFATQYGVPVLSAAESTSRLMSDIISILGVELAPRVTRHGVLVEVYGEGILILGESGVGKSETAVELVKRGHRLIADDAVEIKRNVTDRLVGTAPELIRHYIELRGIGVIDVCRLFGMSAVKDEAEIDMVINLEQWKDGAMYDRLGLENLYTTILDVQVPSLTVPVRPGRNLAVIIEVAAMNNRHKKMGYNAAVEFTKQINQHFDQAMSAQLNDN